MSKIVRKKHMNIIELLSEAMDVTARLIKEEKLQDCLVLFVDCQESAVALGSHIEKLYGMNTQSVRALEQYCESLYQLSVALDEQVQIGEAYETLKDSMHHIRTTYEKEFPDKKEVVFLPYKAAMWDSLESVWMAARDDEECEAYVVPIPYYDLDGDHNFKEMHYEGDLYPKYVPITSYEEYDLEERHPDMIFIHNPYDEYNRVTSIDPKFYSSRIKDFTEKLVYIPYFILGDIIYDHFCVLPGVINADTVIVQSEKAKNEYIKNLKESSKKTSLLNGEKLEKELENKIIPLGSPKIDKVVNSKKEDYVLPEKWTTLLAGKKAVLYNTGISGLLHGNEQELEKIRDVLDVFKNRRDVVLWWRPHPLNENMLQSMRPHLYKEYMNLVKKFKDEGYGIFDDTQDLHRALVWTDVYYGDDSSLIYLYGVQGKPIIRQNIYVLANAQSNGIDFNTCLYDKENLWILARDHNALYKMDLLSGDIDLIEILPTEQVAETKLYSNLIKDDNMIWMVPFRAHHLCGYNLKEKTFEQYKVEDRIKYSSRYENKIYMVSQDYKHIWIFDLKEKRLFIESINYKTAIDISSLPVRTEYYHTDLYFKNNKMYFVIWDTNLLVEYDLSRNEAIVKQVGKAENRFAKFVMINNQFWFFPVYQAAAITCLEGNKIVTIAEKEYPNTFRHTYGFTECKYWNGLIWLFPARGNMILTIHPETREIKIMQEWDKLYDVENVQIISEDKALFSTSISVTHQRVHVIDRHGKTLVSYTIKRPIKDIVSGKDILKRLNEENYISEYGYECGETEVTDLMSLLESVSDEMSLDGMKKYFRNIYSGGDGKSGLRIWDKMKV